MIDAEVRSEERFSKLSLAYDCEEEKCSVCSCIENIIDKYDIKPETYTTCIANGKEVIVIEYHDDISREAGVIFEEIIKTLDIKSCN
jgi:hypothetical protein